MNKKNSSSKNQDVKDIIKKIVPDQKILFNAKTLSQKFSQVQLHYVKKLIGEGILWVIGFLSMVPLFGWIFLYGPFKIGQSLYYRELKQGRDSLKVLWAGFKRDRYWKSVALGSKKSFNLLGWASLGGIPALFKNFEYSFYFEIALDNPELSPLDCLNRASQLMQFNKINFLKWVYPFKITAFLSVFTFGLLNLFFNPLFISYQQFYYAEILEKIRAIKPNNQFILEVRNLRKYFPLNTNFLGVPQLYLKAVDDVSIQIEKGKTLGIVGESGCGKTTFGRTVLGLYPQTSGTIYFDQKNIGLYKGSELNKLRKDIQIIFQDPYSSLSPRMPIGEIIGEGVRLHKIVPKEQWKPYVLEIMKKCGLQEHYFDRYPHEFSGGQRQRICIARALAVNPKFVVCDEPVSALDVSIQAQIINLLKDLQREFGLTYLFISHDLSVVEHISDSVGVMYLGSMVETAHKNDLFKNPLHPYTKSLLSSVPIPDPDQKMERVILQGDIPSPANPPKGCKFHTRCNQCMDQCKVEIPKMKELESGHFVACHLYEKE